MEKKEEKKGKVRGKKGKDKGKGRKERTPQQLAGRRMITDTKTNTNSVIDII